MQLLGVVMIQVLVMSPIGVCQQNDPTVPELMTGVEKFHEQWQSVQLEIDGTQLQIHPTKGGWAEHGFTKQSRAWDEANWHLIESSAFEFLKDPGDFHAEVTEGLGAQNTVLQVNLNFRPPTEKEMLEGDMTWIDPNNKSTIVNMATSWFDGESGIKRFTDHRANRIELLTGRISKTEQLLELFDTQQCGKEDIMFLNRPCWKISQQNIDATGSASVTICPELDFAPVEFTWTRGINDRFADGKQISECDDGDGHQMLSSNVHVTLEAVKSDWSEFTIRTLRWSDHADSVRMGFGKLEHFSNIARPAPADAFKFQIAIDDGTPVILQNNRQLKAEWRDNRVVRVYDGQAVKELATVAMKPPERSLWPMIFVAVLGCGAIVIAWRRNKGKRVPKRDPMRH